MMRVGRAQGVILYGEPGTGKTLLAKAVANSTSATFLRVVGSELIQKYLGDGPKLVRELFRVADELAPTIVFIGARCLSRCINFMLDHCAATVLSGGNRLFVSVWHCLQPWRQQQSLDPVIVGMWQCHLVVIHSLSAGQTHTARH